MSQHLKPGKNRVLKLDCFGEKKNCVRVPLGEGWKDRKELTEERGSSLRKEGRNNERRGIETVREPRTAKNIREKLGF